MQTQFSGFSCMFMYHCVLSLSQLQCIYICILYVYYMYIYMYYYILYSCELLRLLIDFIYVLMLINQPSGDTWLPHDGRGLIRPWEEPVDGAAIHQGREHSHAHPRWPSSLRWKMGGNCGWTMLNCNYSCRNTVVFPSQMRWGPVTWSKSRTLWVLELYP